MTTEYNHAIIDCSTNEVTVRPMTADEIASLEQSRIEALKIEQDKQDEQDRVAILKESAKAKLIAGEPLTEEEASVLVI